MDIVASSPFGVHDSEILYHMVNLQDEFKHFLFFIRNWINDLNDVHLKKMILLYLAIFYMQKRNVLPSLRKVRSMCRKKIVEGMKHLVIIALFINH